MKEQSEKDFIEAESTNPGSENKIKNDNENMTNLQDESVDTSEKLSDADNVSDDSNGVEKNESWEEKYALLNDSHLRLIAEFDNFRKRTLREKADLIKSGGANVITNILPVVDDFERALNTIQGTEDLSAAINGVKLIYDKFISYLAQQGVKVIDAVGQPFDTEFFEAVAIIPAPDEDMKGKVVDCMQTGYMLYDKVLRHAKVVVGE